MTNLRTAIQQVYEQFEAAPLSYGHGTDNAWDEAVALVLSVTGLEDDPANLDCTLADADCADVAKLAEARISTRQPLAYLTGRCRFAGHEFQIEPGIVIPRSPIGELVQQQFSPWLRSTPLRIFDLCTGSGCIGISCAHAFPDSEVWMVDIEARAAALAERNVEAHGLTSRVKVLCGDLFAPLGSLPPVDLIVCNPPYVDARDMASLPLEYRHEPALGLAAGDDGLDIVRRVLAQATQFLAPSGTLVCEVGASAGHLLRAYPQTPFMWPSFEHGGEGVFVLDAESLPSHTARTS